MKQETQNELERFRDYLREQEKSSHTIEKYCRDVRKFLMFAGEEWDKNTIISFKEYLQAHYKTSSANSMLASLNSYFHFIGRQEYCVRTFRVQKRIFCDERREMTRSDYQKLVKAARGRGDERLCCDFADNREHGHTNQRAFIYYSGIAGTGGSSDRL